MEKHVLDDRAHASDEDAYNAALGHVVLSYLESLPPKARLTALLALKGAEGYPETQLLAAAEDGTERDATLQAARELAAERKLRRVRRSDGEIFWKPAGPLLAEGGARSPRPDEPPKERLRPAVAPEGAHDGGPQTGGTAM
jgi:hypothetical protein